jgi:hypothetical protein
MTQPQFFLNCTENAVDSMTELFNFMWPTAEAQHFMRESVNRLVLDGVNVKDAVKQLMPNKRYDRSHIECVIDESSAQRQIEILSRTMLVNVFAIFEGWISDAVQDIGYGTKIFKNSQLPTRKIIAAMQFPKARGADPGMTEALTSLRASRSDVMDSCFGLSLKSRKRNTASDDQLLKLMYCYRHFKEIRNAIVHRNGKANAWNVKAQEEYFCNVECINDLGEFKSNGDLTCEISDNSEVHLELRCVAATNRLILRLMTSWESEMALTVGGEIVLMRRIRKTPSAVRSLGGNKQKAMRAICHHAGIGVPSDYDKFEEFLIRRHLLKQ